MANESVGYHRYKVTISIIAVSIFLLSKCMNADNNNATKKDTAITATVQQKVIHAPSYEQYAGSASCKKCHQDIANHFIHTSHHLTSAVTTSQNIKGSFADGSNAFFYDQNTTVVM